MILGLTGSIGSGKSFVSDLFERAGVPVIRADDLAREVVAPGTPGFEEVVARFGRNVVLPDGTLDRRAIAARVFADPDERRALESIIHPRVRAREEELIDGHAGAPLIVLDIPLLYESGAEAICDAVCVVTVSEQVRRERLSRDRGMTAEEVRARLAAQMPQAEKVRRAAHVIDNSGSRHETEAAVTALLRGLTGGGIGQ